MFPGVQLNPSRRAAHLSWAGAGAIAIGIALSLPQAVACGAALLCGVALARALTLASVARARAAGFEMLWSTKQRVARLSREQVLIVQAELRNRDSLPTHFKDLNVTCAPSMEVSISPRNGLVPAKGRLLITLHVRARRVGYHGLFGLTLHTVRAPGLYTVPLSFSNPFVVEVLPRSLKLGPQGARGGRSRTSAPDGRIGPLSGDGPELKELREHRPGDPFKRIAWKASARRGRLLVVEKEREERDVVWLFLDASVDSASGPPGRAGLDLAVDQFTYLAEYHLARGDLVGVQIFGARLLSRVAPGRGPRHAAELISALTFCTHTADADRSDWDDRDVVRKVLEHQRSLDSRAQSVSPHDRAAIAQLARSLMGRAPVRAQAPWAAHPDDQLLRQYLLSFGVQPPPRGSSERHATELRIAESLRHISGEKPRPSIVYVSGKAPSFETPPALLDAMATVPKRRTEIRFLCQDESATLSATVGAASSSLEASTGRDDPSMSTQAKVATGALRLRLELATDAGSRELAKRGVKVLRPTQPGGLRTKARSMTSWSSTSTRTLKVPSGLPSGTSTT